MLKKLVIVIAVLALGASACSSGVSISSAEAFPTKAEAISAAAMKVLDMPDRLEEFDASTAEV